MHFGYYITTHAALAWAHGRYSDADLLLLDDAIETRNAKNFYWIGSVKNHREAFECRAYGPRFDFRSTVATITKWAEANGFTCGMTEKDGSKRFWGSLKTKTKGVS